MLLKLPFYKRVKKLQEKIQDCKTREDIALCAHALEVDVIVEYNSTTYFSFAQNLRDGMWSGSVRFAVKATVTDGKTASVARSTLGCHVFGNDMTKEDLEREHVKAIICTLLHLDIEDKDQDE